MERAGVNSEEVFKGSEDYIEQIYTSHINEEIVIKIRQRENKVYLL